MARPKNANGMGSITRMKDGRLKWKQMVDGQQRQITAKTPKELQEKIKTIAGLPIVKNKMTTSDWFEKWLVSVKSLRKPATYEQYNTIWEQHIKPVIGKRKITSIKKYDIQQVISKMNTKVVNEAVKDESGKIIKPEKIGLSTWTMKHARKIMNIAFTKALEDKFIAENPVVGIDIPKKQAKQRKTFTPPELSALFSVLSKSRWIWAVCFLLHTGLRRGELLALKWSSIDFKNKKIIIDSSLTSAGVGDTKSAKIHYVPLSEKAIFYLNKQKQMLIDEINPILHNEELGEANLVFPSKNGTMMRPDSFNNVIVRAAEKVNVHASPHMFRHTFVYITKGILTLPELQEALGHDARTSTTDIYGTMLSDTHKVANKIDGAFGNLEEEIDEIEKKAQNKEQCKVIQFRKVSR